MARIGTKVNGKLYHPAGTRPTYGGREYSWAVTTFTVQRPKKGYETGEVKCLECGTVVAYKVPSLEAAREKRAAYLGASIFLIAIAGASIFAAHHFFYSVPVQVEMIFVVVTFLAGLAALVTLVMGLTEQGRPVVDLDRPPKNHALVAGHPYPTGV